MPDEKSRILSTLSERQDSYGHVVVKGLALNLDGKLRPVTLLVRALRREAKHAAAKTLCYSDLVLFEDNLSVERLNECLANLGGSDTELPLTKLTVTIPPGLFRRTDEGHYDQEIQMRVLGQSGPLDTELVKLLTETRSYPRSTCQDWPTRVFSFGFNHSSHGGLFYQAEHSQLPIVVGAPAFPSLRDAMVSWLGKEVARFDFNVLLYLPDYRARIAEVRSVRDRFVVRAEGGTIDQSRLLIKYFALYDDLRTTDGDLTPSENSEFAIPTEGRLQKLHIVLTAAESSGEPIDYRTYQFDPWNRTQPDYTYDGQDVEWRIEQGESETTEFKVEIGKKDEFLETICSFSNTRGGVLLMGVDNNGNAKGINPGEMDQLKRSIGSLVRDWIEPTVSIRMNVAVIKEKAILVIVVPKGDQTIYNYRDHGVYMRAGSTDRLANRDELLSLFRV
jgi:hypothetical protein